MHEDMTDSKGSSVSTYDFMRDVVGYDLAAFFRRNSEVLRKEVEGILTALLTPEHGE